MRIRCGFVSNSSSSSFIISDIKGREDYFVDYPPLSSMTEYMRLRNEGFYEENEKHKGKAYKEQRNVYYISANGGKAFTVESVNDIIQKHKFHAKVLSHYEEDWGKYLSTYDCIIMDISKVDKDQAKSVSRILWGEDYIWNYCHSICGEWNYSYWDWKDIEDFSVAKRFIDYTESPLYRMFINSEEAKELIKECLTARDKDKEALTANYADYQRYAHGELAEKPIRPITSTVSNVQVVQKP